MKKILTFIIFCTSFIAFSQELNTDPKEMYSLSMKNHIRQIENYIKEGIITYKLEDIYFISEYVPRDVLPEFIDNYKVNYLNIYDKGNTRLLKKGIRAISIQPIKLSNNKIQVYLIDFDVILKKGKYKYSNGGGSITTYEFSCDFNGWVFKGTEF